MYLDELKIACSMKQMVSLKTRDGKVRIGLPCELRSKDGIKFHGEGEVVSIPFNEITHVMRLINFR
ncbi:hypothetical protein [Paenibacillus sp. J22TS3]|uniref:hypothetical protein n=1 Tax=Paenibacillus sp. J22TS3 TaxID=2807192 RepID=UPI0008399F4D|nr:hypothetical protein [Paenibacillus sp. J22TS3]GIP19943.1 hypothetical protein J22TS3_02180 [Paenibacillus sp. J22TS3]